VELIDQNPSRAKIAQAIGVKFAMADASTPDADLVVHASGSPSGLSLALRLAAYESRVVELSWYGRSQVPLALGESFHSRRLRLVSSQVGAVAPSQRARWDRRRRMSLALQLLADSSLDALVTDESTFSDLPEVMARLAAAPGDTLCHRIRYA
jgi:threonine dehydrogenase-like Zn-dependent dehydrogenase